MQIVQLNWIETELVGVVRRLVMRLGLKYRRLVLVLLVLVVGVVEGVVVVGEARRQAPWVVGRLVALKRAIQR
jgi:hypothetical protein